MEIRFMAYTGKRHLDEDQAEEYSAGVLSEAEQALCEEHLLVCETCRETVHETDQFLRAMKSAAREEAGTVRERSWGPWFGLKPGWIFATAVLLLGSVSLLRYEPDGNSAAVRLSALRGAQTSTVAPAGRNLLLIPDVSGLPQSAGYRVEVVDADGQAVWNGSFAANGTHVPPQKPGIYFVRIRNSNGELLREYGLEVSRTPGASDAPR
jgi:hypothetical protein